LAGGEVLTGGIIANEETRPYDVVCAEGICDEVVRTRIVFRRVA